MEIYTGKSISDGIAIGKVKIYTRRKSAIVRVNIEDVETEIRRFESAKRDAVEQLKRLYEKAVDEMGESNAAIFKAHWMLLEDIAYNEVVYNTIRNNEVNAECAVVAAEDKFSRMFLEMENKYFKERALDVKDISRLMLDVLAGAKNGDEFMDGCNNEPVIIVADSLSPSEILQIDRTKLLAFVTLQGSVNSHAAILARTMNIPALTGVLPVGIWEKRRAIVDGKQGIFIVEPEDSVLQEYMEEKRKEETERIFLARQKGRPSMTTSGKRIKLYANIGSILDVGNVLANDAEGIGLFRTEILYLEKEGDLTEEEQFAVYKTVAQRMDGKPVVIRTLDLSGDKQLKGFKITDEVLRTQLRAIYRAAAYGRISIMFPMINSVSEVQKIKKLCEGVKAELDEKRSIYGDAGLGIMIETPVAVMVSDELAKEVDFFSIGTNDLIQYALGIDRQNPKHDTHYDTPPLEVMRMIQRVINNGHTYGCKVGICGELGSDTSLTETFVNMGIDEFSVSPAAILPIRKIIREM